MACVRLFLILCVFMPSLYSLPTSHGRSPLLVETRLGAIRGVFADNSLAFLGVPYAQPPIRSLRWKPPVERRPWLPRVFEANQDAPGCPQRCNDPPTGCPKQIKEDCLYMNIFVPSRPNISTPLPVMVFLHGGNFQSGGSSGDIYDGRYLSHKADVIVVVPNYRLGALGFFYLVENDVNIEGNFGLKDQELALKFIFENIESFGGDPNKITLVGQSAGAESTAIHYLNQEVSGYFSQIVMLSNPFSLPLKTHQDANRFSKVFLSNLRCDSTSTSANLQSCLMSKTAKEIVDAQLASNPTIVNSAKQFQTFQPWGPVVRKQPIERFATEKIKYKPIMMSSMTEEARIFVYEAFTRPIFSLRYMIMMMTLVPNYHGSIMKYYPRNGGIFSFRDERDVISRLVTDYVFICSALSAAKTLQVKGGQSVYYYITDQAYSFGLQGWDQFSFQCSGHTCHGGDLAYLFRSAPIAGYTYSTPEQDMMDQMTSYLTNFFHNGDPNEEHFNKSHEIPLPEWHPVGSVQGNGPAMVFSSGGTRIANSLKSDICNFWDKVGYFNVNNVN